VRPAPNPISWLILPIAFLMAFVPAACGGGNTETETSARPAAAARSRGSGQGEQAGEGDENWNHWRWNGKRQACFFRHRNRCYDKLEAACRAAGCEESKCSHDSSAPAVVSCRK
jgi:hypothetical protein